MITFIGLGLTMFVGGFVFLLTESWVLTGGVGVIGGVLTAWLIDG